MKRSVKIFFSLVMLIAVMSSGAVSAAEKVSVGTEGAFAPYNYVTADGRVDGYDIAVMRAIDELVPEIEFSYEPTEWSSIFVALESGKYDIIASNITYSDERAKKYLFSDIYYNHEIVSIVFKEGREDIRKIEDLHGKTVTAGLGSFATTWLEGYNAQHGNSVKISYSDGDVSKALQELVSGRSDATLSNPVTVTLISKEQGLPVRSIFLEDIGIGKIHLLFANNENGRRYKELIDPALKKLKDDGTLSKLCAEYLGADYTTEEAIRGQVPKQ
ncbi:MAG: transporter substrate-binding domain-containing protein [Synergistaceae bacterium]|nr:transporter substrate-binding domain-containing protein [Synergistaceae bacterium]